MADTITVVCPHCTNEMRASVKHIGRKGKCSRCGNLVTITTARGDASTVSFADATVEEAARAPAGTHVNQVLAGVIGLAVTVALYVGFYALAARGNYLGVFMTERSVIQHAITLVTCWGLAILALKYLAVQRELRSTERELELIPLEIGMQITSANVDKFLDHVHQLPAREQTSFLARRLRGALEHFKHRNNVSEVQSYLATQADIEASGVDSGYTLLRVFIWVCPILGFIGTVLGIGWAVTDLAKALPEAPAATAPAAPGAPPAPAENLGEKLVQGMRDVTAGLATAFDTTLLGLVCVVLLMFPTEALKKIEYGMLDRVQGFANESLLRRMAEGEQDDGQMPEVVRQALDAAFKEHQKWLAQWQAQVAKLGTAIGADFESHLAGFQDRVVQAEKARVETMAAAARRAEEVFGQLSQLTAAWQKGGTGGDLKEAVAAVTQLHASLVANTEAVNKVLAKQGELMEKYATSDLAGVLRSLSDAVAKLGETGVPANGPPTGPAMLVPTPPTIGVSSARGPAGGKRAGFLGRIFGSQGD